MGGNDPRPACALRALTLAATACGDDDDDAAGAPTASGPPTLRHGRRLEAAIAFTLLADERAQGCYRGLLVGSSAPMRPRKTGVEFGEPVVEHRRSPRRPTRRPRVRSPCSRW